MQGANKTINTKVGLDLPMSEQVRQRLVTLNEGKTLVRSAREVQHNFTCTSTHLIYCISCSRCGMLYIGETGRQLRTRFGEHRRAVSANFNSGSHCISDMKIRALCPISGSNDSRKRQEMRLISKLGTVHPLGINERFFFI